MFSKVVDDGPAIDCFGLWKIFLVYNHDLGAMGWSLSILGCSNSKDKEQLN